MPDYEKLVSEEKIVAIIRGIPAEAGDRTAQALAAGGIVFLEVTLNTDGAFGMIRRFSDQYAGRLHIGAGTVLSVEMAKRAIDAGAKYIISPNLDEAVVTYAVGQGVDVWPGTMTPSEMVRAHQLGASAVKVFPMGTLGVSYLKEVRAPLGHIPMITTGGVQLDNIQDFLRAGALAVGIGGNLVNKTLIAQGRFDEIEALARQYVDLAKGANLA